MGQKKHLDVVVGIIIRGEKILIAQRPLYKPHALCWEFPGGKVEANESIELALQRELEEEVGVRVQSATLLGHYEHEYPSYHVVLHTFVITDFLEEPTGLEGQAIKWIGAAELTQHTFPAANYPIIQALQQVKFCSS